MVEDGNLLNFRGRFEALLQWATYGFGNRRYAAKTIILTIGITTSVTAGSPVLF
jgi:hypothetical protein